MLTITISTRFHVLNSFLFPILIMFIFSGDMIYKLDGFDPDEGVNGQITYQITGPDSSKFLLDPDTGLITAFNPLDSEQTYTLDLEIRDKGSPQLSARSVLKLQTAERSLFPVFSSPVSEVRIPENQEEVELPQLEANSLNSQEWFNIDIQVFSLFFIYAGLNTFTTIFLPCCICCIKRAGSTLHWVVQTGQYD